MLILAVFAFVLWMLVRPRDPVVHGKRQSEWINAFTNKHSYADAFAQINAQQDEVKQWRELGPEGIHMLCQAMEEGTGWPARAWLNFYYFWGPAIQRYLPEPRDTSGIRSHAAFLVGSLAKQNKDVAIPAMLRAMKNDSDSYVRLNITAALDSDLFKGRDKDRLAFLPELIRAATDPNDQVLRDNAYFNLRMYPDQAGTLVPTLSNALSDNWAEGRWNAILTLHQLAPDAAKPQIVEALTKMIRAREEEQFLPGRIEWLGDMRKDALDAVPVLQEASHSTNAAIAEAAQHALAKITP